METMILLNKEQADQIRGNYGKYSALAPIQVVEGFALPVDVLDNPEFATILNYLYTLPIQEVTLIEQPELNEDIY
jgi:hypothetical protein